MTSPADFPSRGKPSRVTFGSLLRPGFWSATCAPTSAPTPSTKPSCAEWRAGGSCGGRLRELATRPATSSSTSPSDPASPPTSRLPALLLEPPPQERLHLVDVDGPPHR